MTRFHLLNLDFAPAPQNKPNSRDKTREPCSFISLGEGAKARLAGRSKRQAQLVGGAQERAAILRALQRGKCCSFIGARHQDKSRLMRAARVEVVEQLGYLGLYISLWDIHTTSLTAFLRALRDLIIEDARQSFGLTLPRIGIHTAADLVRFLECIPVRARRNTVLFVDDLTREAVPPACTSELLRLLRAAYQNTPEGWRLLAVVCASNSLARTALGPTSPFETISELVSVGALNRVETAELVTQVLGTRGAPPTPDALEYIFEQTCGDRFLVRQISLECRRQVRQSQRVTRRIVHKAIEQLLHSAARGPLAEGLRELESNPRLLQTILNLIQDEKILSTRASVGWSKTLDPLEALGFVVAQVDGYHIKSPLHYHLLKQELTPERVGRIFLAAGEWARALDYLQIARGDELEHRARIMAAVVSAMYSMPDCHAARVQLLHGLRRAYPHQTILLYELDRLHGELRLFDDVDANVLARVSGNVTPRLDDLKTPQEYWWQRSGQQRITLFVPVRTTQGEKLGLVSVENLVTAKDFRQRQAQILELVGYVRHAANALKNRSEFEDLQQQIKRRASDLENLQSVTEKLMRSPGLFGEVLKQVLDRALEAFQGRAQTGSVWIYHPDKGALTLDAQYGFPETIRPSLRPNEGLAGRVYAEGVLRNIADTLQDEQLVDLGIGYKPRSTIGVPLIGRRSTLGVLCLDNAEQTAAFDQNDEQLLQIFAGQVALWLEQVRAVDTLRQKRDMARLATKLVHQLAGIINAAPEVLDEIKVGVHSDKTAKLIDELQRKVYAVSQIGYWLNRYIRLDQMVLDTFEPVELIRQVYAKARQRQLPRVVIHEPSVSGDLVSLRADPVLIRVLIENLLDNAIEALSRTDAQGEIHSRIEKQDEFCVIQIWDNGPGIPEEQRTRIWEAGYTTKQRQGIESGLGLHLCHHIVQAHYGSIALTDVPTGGACFTIRLPIAGLQTLLQEEYA